jgi:hypothetical protein
MLAIHLHCSDCLVAVLICVDDLVGAMKKKRKIQKALM